MNRPLQHLCPVLLGIALTTSSSALEFKSGVSLPTGGEILSYSNGQLLATNSFNTGTSAAHAVQVYSLNGDATLSAGISIDLSPVFSATNSLAISSVSSVAADSRGFGVAAVIPAGKTLADFGRVAFFDISTGSILNTLDVGYHPDSVAFSPDGTKLIVTNEGEYGSTVSSTPEAFARPGSISVIDLSSVTSGAAVAGLTSANVATYDFTAANLGSGVTLTGIRDNTLVWNNATTVADFTNIEPEYTVATDTKAFITLQENNAVATFDFATGKYESIKSLGTITQVIDASDRDGPSNGKSISINDTVTGLPMPDTVVKFERSGVTYLVTANEGDARPDDRDIFRGSQQGTTVSDSLAPDIVSTLDGIVNNTGIGRLNLLKDMGDTDGDNVIDQPTMLGTRSFSIWNSTDMSLAFDSASMIEQYVAANDPDTFNINNGLLSDWDTRSDDKGPEPEAVAFGSINGRDYVFIGAERQNGIFQFDITDLGNVTITNYFNALSSTEDSGGAFISPESMQFLPGSLNPTGLDLLLVGFEGTSNGNNGSIAVFSVVPEPGTALLGLLGSLAFLRRRRR